MVDPVRDFCVIGCPVEHSISPRIHEWIFRRLSLDLHYGMVRVPEGGLAAFIEQSRLEGRPGFNVTIPHKEAILPFLDSIEERAVGIGAVNTVAHRRGKLEGYNTDVDGFRRALSHARVTPGGFVVLLGAGGAARAAVTGFSEFSIDRLIVTNRNIDRAMRLQEDFKGRIESEILTLEWDSEEMLQSLSDADMVVNATPVGMWPAVQECPVPGNVPFRAGSAVFDMIPNPARTRLLEKAERDGARTISGVSMLIGQAIASEEIWLDRMLPDEVFDELWAYMKREMNNDG